MRVPMVLLLLLSACGADPCRLEPVAAVPVRLYQNVPVLLAGINGHRALLVLDTGSEGTILTPAAAARLGVEPGPERVGVGGAAGALVAGRASIAVLALGPAAAVHDVRAFVAEGPPPPLDGVLGIDVLSAFEIDLDVPNGRATLYKARSCPAMQPAWTMPFQVLATQQQGQSGHLFVPVGVDGQPLRGVLDTGASFSVLSLQAARDVGVTPRALAALPGGRGQAFGTGGFVVRRARFRELRVGRDVVPSPVLGIGDLPPFAGDLVVGSDYLGTRRVWISFLLGRVFVAS